MFSLLEKLIKDQEDRVIPGNAKEKNIDKTCRFYHVIQQTDNRNNYFTSEVSKHRDSIFKYECQRLGVIPLFSVIMPSHTHDVVFSNSIDKIQQVVKYTNRSTSVFLKKSRLAKGQTVPKVVYNLFPGYVGVKSRKQFYILIKYIYDNPVYLKEAGEYVPYSCFDSWEKGYFKPYNVKLIEEILNLKITDILKDCAKLSREQFKEKANELFGKDSEELNNSIFKKQ